MIRSDTATDTTPSGDDPTAPAFTSARLELLPGVHRDVLVGAEAVAPVVDEFLTSALIASDIETNGVKGSDRYHVKVVSFANDTHALALNPRVEADAALIRKIYAEAAGVAFHNSPFDVTILVLTGLASESLTDRVFDTLILSITSVPGAEKSPGERLRHSLADVVSRQHGIDIGTVPREEWKKHGARSIGQYYAKADLSDPVYLTGALADSVATFEAVGYLHRLAMDHLLVGGKDHPAVGIRDENAARALIMREQRVNRVMLRSSARGLAVDRAYAKDYLEGESAQRQAARAAEMRAADLPVTSGAGKKLVSRLDEEGTLPSGWPRTDTGQPSAKAEDMERLAEDIPLAATVLAWGREEKLRSYVEKIVKEADAAPDGRLHPSINVAKASTGRMAVSDPPLQQYPAEVRPVIVADEGRSFTSLDWTSQEPYLAAAMARDMALVEHYESGGDIYEPITTRAGVDRDTAKTVVLGLFYGLGNAKLAADLGVTSAEAQDIQDYVKGAMPGITTFIERAKANAVRGYVPTVSGRYVTVSRDPRSNGGIKVYKSVNMVVQGSAADSLYDAIVRIEEAGLGWAVHLPIHDELVVDSEAADEIAGIMENPPAELAKWLGRPGKFRVDRAELGRRWDKA